GLKKGEVLTFDVDKFFGVRVEKARMLGLSEDEAETVRGKFDFTVTSVSSIEPAAAEQEVFDSVFVKDTVSTEEEFINKVRQTIGENYQRESDQFTEHLIEDYLLKHTTIDLLVEFLRS